MAASSYVEMAPLMSSLSNPSYFNVPDIDEPLGITVISFQLCRFLRSPWFPIKYNCGLVSGYSSLKVTPRIISAATSKHHYIYIVNTITCPYNQIATGCILTWILENSNDVTKCDKPHIARLIWDTRTTPDAWSRVTNLNPKTSGLRRQRFRGLGRVGQLFRDK